MSLEQDVSQMGWSEASKKRRLLAAYIDYLFFGVPWVLLVWWVSSILPGFKEEPLYIKIAFFLALEALILRFIQWSPGHSALGIRSIGHALALEARTHYVVDPWLKSNERWWTILFGVFAILSGAKAMVRWTMWTPPIPFMGVQLDMTSSAVVSVVLGGIECAVGIAALRLHSSTLPLGLGLYTISLVSLVLSWNLWPGWIERYTLAKRAYQGIPTKPGEIERMQSLIPGMIVLATIMLFGLLAVNGRSRNARSSQTRSDPAKTA